MAKTKKIVRFSARDVLRLSAVEITPEGNVVTLGGENGAGKSSVLNAIQMALGGKRLTPKRAIREGAEQAEVVVDLGDIIIERVITAAGGDRLVVKTPEGATYPKPQETLNKLFNAIAFDPLKFANEDEGEQAETLRRIVPGLDFSADDKRSRELFDERTVVGRDIKAMQARLNAMTAHPDVPANEISVADLAAELDRRLELLDQKVALHNIVGEAQNAVGAAEDAITKSVAYIERLERELAEAKAALEGWHRARASAADKVEDATAAYDAFVVPDPQEVRDQLATVETTNRKVRENGERAKLAQSLEARQAKYAELTKGIDEIDASKAARLKAAAFPVPGLSLGAGGVLFDSGNGGGPVPFAQASKAEQIRVSFAIAIAMNPDLRVAFVRDASLLTDKSLALVAQLAAEHDFQVWIEDARTTDPAAVIIEDGHVRGKQPTAAE